MRAIDVVLSMVGDEVQFESGKDLADEGGALAAVLKVKAEPPDEPGEKHGVSLRAEPFNIFVETEHIDALIEELQAAKLLLPSA